MIRSHLEEENSANSTPKNVARRVSGGVWGCLGGGLGGLGAPWAGFLEAVKDDEAD